MPLFEAAQNAIHKYNAPLLVIGLGGTGAKGLLRVKDTFRKHFVHDRTPEGRELPNPPLTAFLAIDTDTDTLAFSCNGTKIDVNNDEWFKIDGNLEYVLDPQRNLLTPWEKDWLDSRLTAQQIRNGAGQIRQAGRLGLLKNTTELTNRLSTIIHKLVSHDQHVADAINEINVAVISGLCGGTGSGTFLDVAYLIRHVCQTQFAGLPLDLTAYLYMPDVTMQAQGDPPDSPRAITSAYNGFSALKELDYWMNVEEHKEYHLQKYNDTISHTWDKPPFDMCTLLCASKSDGTPITRADDVMTDVLAESMLHYYAGENAQITTNVSGMAGVYDQGDGNDGGMNDTFGPRSDRANTLTQVQQLTKKMPRPYVYRCIGAYSNRGEQQDMFNYEAHMVFQQIRQCAQNNQPVMDGTAPGAFMEAIFSQTFSVENNSCLFMTEFENDTGWNPALFGNEGEYSAKLLKKLDASSAMHKDPYEAYKQMVNERTPALMTAKENNLWEGFKSKAKAAIEDPNRGPAWLETMLSAANTGILARLRAYIEQTTTKYDNTHAARVVLEGQTIEQLYDAYVNAGFLSVNSAFTNYKQSAMLLYQYYQHEVFFQKWIQTLESIHARITNYCNNYLHLYNLATEEIATELSRTVSQTNNMIKRFINVQSLRAEIQRIFQDEPTRDKLMLNVMEKLADNTFAAMDALQGTDAANDIVESFSRFIQDTYNSLGNMNLDDMIRQYGGDENNPANNVAQYVQNTLAPYMVNAATPMFATGGEYRGLNTNHAVHYGFISVPENAPQTMAGIKAYIQNSNFRGATIKASNFTDRIFWLTSCMGLPMSAYTPLEAYATKYEANVDGHMGNRARGMHLVRTQQTQHQGDCRYDWSLLPSPYIYKVMGGEAPSDRVINRDSAIHSLLAAARDCGILLTNMTKEPFCQLRLLACDPPIINTSKQTEAFRKLEERITAGIQAALALSSNEEREAALKALIAPEARRTRDIEGTFVNSKIDAYMSYLHLAEQGSDPQARERSFQEVIVDVLTGYPATLREIELNVRLVGAVRDAIDGLDIERELHTKRLATARDVAYMMMFGVIDVKPRVVAFRDSNGGFRDANGELNRLFDNDMNVDNAPIYGTLPIYLRLVHWLTDNRNNAYPVEDIYEDCQNERGRFDEMDEGDPKRMQLLTRADEIAGRVQNAIDELRRRRAEFKQTYDNMQEILTTMFNELKYV